MKIGSMNHPQANVGKEIEWISDNFDFIDLTYEPPQSHNYDINTIKSKIIQKNIEIVGHTSPCLPAIFPIEEVRSVCVDELKKAVRFFLSVGARKVSIHPFYNAPNLSEDQIIEANLEVFASINAYCKGEGITLMVENYISPFDTVEIFKLILESAPGIKIHLDVGHCNLEGNAYKTVERFFNVFGKNIIHLHMHDNDGDSDEHLPLGCGCGDIDWKKIIQLIKNSGYNETITLEVFCEDPDYLLLSKRKLLNLWEES